MGRKTQKIEEMGYENLPNFERKQFPTFVKSFDEAQGIVEHFVAVMGNIDEGDDRIMPGSFLKSIREGSLRVKVLDQHSTDSVTRIVGRPLELREVGRDELTPEVLQHAPDATGALLARTQYAIDTTRGRDVFNLVKGGYAPESSIGYDATQTEDTKELGPDGKTRKVRNLIQIRLWEYSNVIWGMNRATAVVSAKSVEEALLSTEDETMSELTESTKDQEEEAPEEEKAGRVYSARNLEKIRTAYNSLRQALDEAGLLEEIADNEEEEKDNGATGPQKSKESPTSNDRSSYARSVNEAGPNSSDECTRLKYQIQFELEKMKLLEV